MRLPFLQRDPLKPGMPEHLTLWEARTPQYFYENQPYLGFVPIIDVFEGPIFGRFHGSRPSLTEQIVENCGSYIMKEELADSWIRAEFALTIIAQHFYNPLRPLSTPTPAYPRSTKYYESKPTLKRAIDSVMYAQKLFVFLIAELRHNIAISPRFDKLKTTWDKYLVSSDFASKMDKVWLANLATSKAMNTVHLAGYYIDPTSMDERMLRRMRIYSQHFAPLYIILAKINRTNPYKSQFFATLTQKKFEMLGGYLFSYKEAQLYIQKVEFRTQSQYLEREFPKQVISQAPQHPGMNTSPYVPTPRYTPHPNDSLISPQSPNLPTDHTELDDVPESLPNSGQRPGQWWYQYLQVQRDYHRRDSEYSEIWDEEERTQQEFYFNYYNSLEELPQDFHAVVYAWKPTPLHPTYLLRTPLEMCEVRAYWSKYPRTHRIFDIFVCVWDLYDPSCDMVALTRHSGTSTVEDAEPATIDAGVEPLSQEMRLENISMPDLLDDRLKIAKMAKARLQQNIENHFYFHNPIEYASHRYGTLLPPHTFDFRHNSQVKWWLYLGKNLQEEKFDNMEILSNTLDCLLQGHRDHLRVLLDIFVRPLELINDNRVHLRRIPQAVFRTVEGEDTRNLYLLQFSNSKNHDWVIGVNSAANVVLALRENWANGRNIIVRNFLK